jgi:hypothetical protein
LPRAGKKQLFLQLAAEHNWQTIGEAEWREISACIPGISASLVEAAGLTVEQPWRGVRQHSFDELEQSLVELAQIYAARPELARFIRTQVITAKDHAKWAARSPRVEEAKRQAKAEMAEWMLVWLDDPSMFAAWAARRRAVRDAPEPT